MAKASAVTLGKELLVLESEMVHMVEYPMGLRGSYHLPIHLPNHQKTRQIYAWSLPETLVATRHLGQTRPRQGERPTISSNAAPLRPSINSVKKFAVSSMVECDIECCRTMSGVWRLNVTAQKSRISAKVTYNKQGRARSKRLCTHMFMRSRE